MQTHSFTAKADCISRILETEILICQSFDPASTPAHQHPKLFPFNAVWDTGATGSVITKKVAQQCGLVPIGMTEVYHAQGKSLTNIYLVNIYLPHGVLIAGLRVTEGDLNSFDALVGMDIINRGDFAVTNKDGKTVFSFRMPSVEVIDFLVQKPYINTASAPGRNDPCKCGSGKKYKKCCLNKPAPASP